MASFVFDRFKFEMLNFNYELENSDQVYQVALVNTLPFDASASYIVSNNLRWYEVSAAWSISADPNFMSDGYYERGLSGTGVFLDSDSGVSKWSATDITWENSNIDARGAVIFYSSSDKWLMCAIDFGDIKQSKDGAFTLKWDDSIILHLR